jgi:hypothetical protein
MLKNTLVCCAVFAPFHAFATLANPSALEDELADISRVMKVATDMVAVAWTDPNVQSLTDVCASETGITNNTSLVGGNNTVATVVCDENGVITVTMKPAGLYKSLRGNQFVLTPAYKNEDTTLGFTDLNRGQLYDGAPANTVGIATFKCVMTFGAEATAVGGNVEFQYSQPPGTIKQTDHFKIADNITAETPGKGLGDWCSGAATAALGA